MGNMFRLGDCRRGIIRSVGWVGGWVERGVLCLEGCVGLGWIGLEGQVGKMREGVCAGV